MATVDDGSFQHITVTLTSVSKTFNLAGVAESQIIITNPILKKLYEIGRGRAALWGPNWSGPLATRAAYSDEGHKWVDALCIYLLNNAQLVRAACAFGSVDVADRCKENATFPLGITPIPIEATFLMWLDARQLTKWIVQYEPTPEHVDTHIQQKQRNPNNALKILIAASTKSSSRAFLTLTKTAHIKASPDSSSFSSINAMWLSKTASGSG
eukprot:CAMPEP_0168579212 /NCGR_PEP_ID=MMETSP0420-20121227/83_1 /TAXON_ID=498008 /ORGANISM="Pessonella sp." /LENGTH=211 /DNA_ID=CAMNT_0008613127 /DNA_START=162 /DNA_END=793 /DNA_ORIENTATION=-